MPIETAIGIVPNVKRRVRHATSHAAFIGRNFELGGYVDRAFPTADIAAYRPRGNADFGEIGPVDPASTSRQSTRCLKVAVRLRPTLIPHQQLREIYVTITITLLISPLRGVM